VDEGDLTDEQVDALGLGLQRLEEAMEDLKSRRLSQLVAP
jgi:hypothetical protein